MLRTITTLDTHGRANPRTTACTSAKLRITWAASAGNAPTGNQTTRTTRNGIENLTGPRTALLKRERTSAIDPVEHDDLGRCFAHDMEQAVRSGSRDNHALPQSQPYLVTTRAGGSQSERGALPSCLSDALLSVRRFGDSNPSSNTPALKTGVSTISTRRSKSRCTTDATRWNGRCPVNRRWRSGHISSGASTDMYQQLVGRSMSETHGDLR